MDSSEYSTEEYIPTDVNLINVSDSEPTTSDVPSDVLKRVLDRVVRTHTIPCVFKTSLRDTKEISGASLLDPPPLCRQPDNSLSSGRSDCARGHYLPRILPPIFTEPQV